MKCSYVIVKLNYFVTNCESMILFSPLTLIIANLLIILSESVTIVSPLMTWSV